MSIPFTDFPTSDYWWSAARRMDPYYEGAWAGPDSKTVWVNHRGALAQMEAGLGDLPAAWRMSEGRAREVVSGHYHRREVVLALGALAQWKSLTASQLAAVTGVRSFGSDRAEALVALFTLGIIDRGLVATGVWATQRGRAPVAYRLASRPKQYGHLVRPHLSWAQRLAVTAGLPLSGGVGSNRHNILSVELALRAAELLPLQAVLGERLAGLDLLMYESWGREPSRPSPAAGDGVLVREDGLRIVVETTATATHTLVPKINRWAEVLSLVSMDRAPVVVCFLLAPSLTREKWFHNEVARKVRMAVKKASRSTYPGVVGARPSERMFVCSWQDWFPSKGSVSPSFFGFTGHRPTGGGGDVWEEVSLLDVLGDVPRLGSDEFMGVGRTAYGLAGTPYALRVQKQYEPVDLTKIAARRFGFEKGLPDLAPSRPTSGASQSWPHTPSPSLVWPQEDTFSFPHD